MEVQSSLVSNNLGPGGPCSQGGVRCEILSDNKWLEKAFLPTNNMLGRTNGKYQHLPSYSQTDS